MNIWLNDGVYWQWKKNYMFRPIAVYDFYIIFLQQESRQNLMMAAMGGNM